MHVRSCRVMGLSCAHHYRMGQRRPLLSYSPPSRTRPDLAPWPGLWDRHSTPPGLLIAPAPCSQCPWCRRRAMQSSCPGVQPPGRQATGLPRRPCAAIEHADQCDGPPDCDLIAIGRPSSARLTAHSCRQSRPQSRRAWRRYEPSRTSPCRRCRRASGWTRAQPGARQGKR